MSEVDRVPTTVALWVTAVPEALWAARDMTPSLSFMDSLYIVIKGY